MNQAPKPTQHPRLSTRLINKLSVKGRQISDTRRRMAKAKNYYEWLKVINTTGFVWLCIFEC